MLNTLERDLFIFKLTKQNGALIHSKLIAIRIQELIVDPLETKVGMTTDSEGNVCNFWILFRNKKVR